MIFLLIVLYSHEWWLHVAPWSIPPMSLPPWFCVLASYSPDLEVFHSLRIMYSIA